MSNTEITFESPIEQSSYIKVIGVGGGGCNAVNHMFHEGIEGVDFFVCNTDMKSLNSSPVTNKIALAKLGAGNNPEYGKKAAENKADEIREILSTNTQMLFITAGMGGGTGTGAAPVIAEIAKSIDLESEASPKILVVAIVTMPFLFEGNKRRLQAEAGIAELRKHVDSILIINNEKLRSFGNHTLGNAFAHADDVLLTAAKGISEIITASAYVNIDFQDVNTVMQHSGTALMGAGMANGENRALDAITAAATSVLLNDNDIKGAKDVLLNLSFNPEHEITMDEMGIVADYITERTANPDCNVIWGYGTDDRIEDDSLKVILIATGFEKNDKMELPKSNLPINKLPFEDETETAKIESPVVESTEMHIISAEAREVATGTTMDAPQSHANNIIDDQPICVAPVDEVKGRVFVLDEAPEEEPVQVIDMEEERHFEPESNFQMLTKPEPVVEPKKTIIEEPQRVANPNRIADNQTLSRAEKIRRMHDLLRNNPNGPQMIDDMTTEQLTGNAIFETQSSATREACRTNMSVNGIMGSNIYLDDIPD